MNKMKLRLDFAQTGYLGNCEEAVYYSSQKNAEPVKIASRQTTRRSELVVRREWLHDLKSCKIPTGLEEGAKVKGPLVTVGLKMDTLTDDGSIKGFLGMDELQLKRFLGRFVNDPRFDVKLEVFVRQVCLGVSGYSSRMVITPNQKSFIFVSTGGGCGDWENYGAGSDRTQRTSWTGSVQVQDGSETFRKLWYTNLPGCYNTINYSLALWIHPIDGPNQDISDHLAFTRKMLDDGLLADVTILAENGAEIKCHRSVLAAHSPVFAAMFQNDMKETRTGELKMKHLSEESVQAFLDFLYVWKSRAAEESPSACMDLLDAGHQYKVELLEQCMENILLRKPEDWYTGDSLVRLIIYLRNRDLEQLKLRAANLFESKYGDVKKLAAFQELQNPEAVAEVMKLISTAKDGGDTK